MSSPDSPPPDDRGTPVDRSRGSGTGFVIAALAVIILVLAYFLFRDTNPMGASSDFNVTVGVPGE
jgi:hypothetical protein